MADYIESRGNHTFANISDENSEHGDVFHPFVSALIGDTVLIASLIADGMYSLGFIANMMLVFYIIAYRRYRSPIFALILSLAISDLGSCVASIVWVTSRRPFVVGPDWVCHVSSTMSYLSSVGSNYNIAVISVIRFYQLVFPLSAHVNVTTKFIAKVCSLVWINAIAIAISFGFVNGAMELDDSRGDFTVCLYIGNHQHIYDAFAAIWVLLLPLLITVVLQFAKHCIVRKQVSSAHLEAEGGAHSHTRESTDTRAVVIVVMVYIVTTLPIVCGFLVHFIRREDHTNLPIAFTIIDIIYFLNSAINPFIYAFAAQTVRKDILAMLSCKSRDKKGAR